MASVRQPELGGLGGSLAPICACARALGARRVVQHPPGPPPPLPAWRGPRLFVVWVTVPAAPPVPRAAHHRAGGGSPGVTRDFSGGEGDHQGPGGMAGALWEGGSRPGPSPRGCAAEVRRARTRGKEGTRRSWRPVRSGRPGPRMASPGGGRMPGARPRGAEVVHLPPPTCCVWHPQCSLLHHRHRPPNSPRALRGRGRGRSATSTSPRQAPAPSYGGAAERLAQRPRVTSRRTR